MSIDKVNSELLVLATGIALEAGELARTRRVEGVEVAASKSSVEDIVTLADREVEQLIRTRLAEARPLDGFFGEESEADAGSSGLTWIVDPIDGTVNYLYGIPHYAVSIAVVEGEPEPATWRALAGIVFNPASGEAFTATAGGGAFLGSTPIRVGGPPSLDQALIATGFGYLAETRRRQGAIVAQLLPQVRDIRRLGAASLDLCGVACGRVDAYFEEGLNPWDHAAGALIAREAGASVAGRNQRPPTTDLMIAAEPVLAAELERKLAELGA